MRKGAGSSTSVMGWKELSADCAAYHETRGNPVCHAIGIPLIITGLR